jgi:hypothetical protein
MLRALPRNKYGDFVSLLMHTKDLSRKDVEAAFQVEQTEHNALRGPLYRPAGDTVLEAGVCPYFSAVPNHGHVLRSRVTDLCLFSDISDITNLFWTFAFQTPVSSDWLCSLRVA